MLNLSPPELAELESAEEELERIEELVQPLLNDLQTCTAKVESEDTPFWRRAFVRTFFAYVEGDIYVQGRMLLSFDAAQIIELTSKEKAIINEESYDLRPNGKIRKRQLFNSIASRMRFYIRTFKQLSNNVEFQLGEDEGWESFLKVVQIRNRLVHPKHNDDLKVTDGELRSVTAAIVWYAQTRAKIMKTVLQLQQDGFQLIIDVANDLRSEVEKRSGNAGE